MNMLTLWTTELHLWIVFPTKKRIVTIMYNCFLRFYYIQLVGRKTDVHFSPIEWHLLRSSRFIVPVCYWRNIGRVTISDIIAFENDREYHLLIHLSVAVQPVVVTNWAGNCDTRICSWCNQLNVVRQCMLNVSWISQDLTHEICITTQ